MCNETKRKNAVTIVGTDMEEANPGAFPALRCHRQRPQASSLKCATAA